ncbi:hypothetical protein HPB51_000247 [Rhipicephalus microplus]|uniref:Uncharacterized protein n=1 Tax=Rhipicephalus microplus TaxID=6941 RepID=A0A9J6D3G1_RHIMP|nr:hypothetical protein HPB51_000247 [Rhipicephalus microplus]
MLFVRAFIGAKATFYTCRDWASRITCASRLLARHRPDACPGLKPDFCGICGKAVPFKEGAHPSHECTPQCTLCAGSHVIGDRCCKERYRPLQFMPCFPSSVVQASCKKRRRRCRQKSGSLKSPQVAQPSAINPAPPPPPLPGAVALGAPRQGITRNGHPAMRSTVGQPLPAPPNPGLKPRAQGDPSWADRVRKGST